MYWSASYHSLNVTNERCQRLNYVWIEVQMFKCNFSVAYSLWRKVGLYSTIFTLKAVCKQWSVFVEFPGKLCIAVTFIRLWTKTAKFYKCFHNFVRDWSPLDTPLVKQQSSHVRSSATGMIRVPVYTSGAAAAVMLWFVNEAAWEYGRQRTQCVDLWAWLVWSMFCSVLWSHKPSVCPMADRWLTTIHRW